MFSVVEFLEEDDSVIVEAVPTLWIKELEGGKKGCFWPEGYDSHAISRAIKNKSKPTLEWQLYEINSILYTTG